MKMKIAAKSLFAQSDYHELRSLLALLPEQELRIVFLRYWATYSIQEISEDLRLSWDAVDKKLANALRMLRSMYSQSGLEPTRSHDTAA